jgi:ribosomal protein S18 acetylase RimI-like enzyme
MMQDELTAGDTGEAAGGPPPFTIRLLAPEDAAILKPFRMQALHDGQDAFHSSPEEWERPLAEFAARIAAGRTFAAFDGSGAMVGMAMLATDARPQIKLRHKAEIWSVYVAGAARRHGVARRLMEACIAEARRLGYEAVVLTAVASNPHVVAFYERLGFRIFGTERRKMKLPDGSYRDDHSMQLDLV